MKKIPLRGKNGKGKFATVDDESFDYLNQFKWHLTVNGYARRAWLEDKKTKYARMHGEVIDILGRLETDHINGDRLDNRRKNLRACTRLENSRNMISSGRSSTGFKGIYFVKSGNREKRWAARITVNGKKIFLGYYKKIKQAAKAYNCAAIKYFKEFAKVNVI